jgi:hypothetical protein
MTAARVFAIGGLGLAVLGAIGTVVVRIVAPVPILGGFGFNQVVMVGFVIAGLTWASIGALMVVRRPENAIGWLMVLVGVGYSLSQASVSLTFAFIAEGTVEAARLAQLAGWTTVLLQLVTVFQLAIGFLFPTGHVQSPGWGRFMRVFWSIVIVFVVTSLTQPGPLQLIPGVQNPFGVGPDLRQGRPIAPILVVATLISFAGLVLSMVTRYRSAGHVERQQMKWFVLALSLSSIGLGIVSTEVVLLDRPDSTTGLIAFIFLGALVPVAIGIAILRHGLYDIDRIISRTLAYVTITGILAVVFVGVILLVTNVVRGIAQGVIPTSQGQTIAVAVSTLVVFALFQPIRGSVQRAIDHRFDREHYDSEQTVAAFAGRLRNDIDLAAVSHEIVATATTAVHPTQATVWLREAHR